MFGIDIPFDLVWIVDENFAQFVNWVSDFIGDTGFAKIKVQLFLPSRAEGETTYFAFHFTLLGSVTVILGSSSSEFDDVIAGFQFAGEFTDKIARERQGTTGSMREEDGVCVKVEDLFGRYLTETVSVEFELGPAGGETGHKDVDVDLHGLFVVHDMKGLNFLCRCSRGHRVGPATRWPRLDSCCLVAHTCPRNC